MSSPYYHLEGKTAHDVLPSLIAIAITFIVLDTIFVSLRFISRTLIQRVSMGIDDLLILPAYAMNVAMCAIGIRMAKIEMQINPPAGAIIQDPAVYFTVIQPALKCIYGILPLLYMGAVLPKLSLLFLYLRIFINRSVRVWTIVAMVLVVAAGSAFTLTGLFACQPVSYFWNRLIPGKCIPLDTFYRINTPIHGALDLLILIIPMPALWKLQAPKSKKIGLTIVFALAGLGMLACVGRWVVVLNYTSEVLAANTTVIIVSWCIIEPSVYLIAACLPPCSSIFVLITNNQRVRQVFSLGTRARSAGVASKKNGFGLSSKQSSGFGRLADAEYNESGYGTPSKDRSMVREEARFDDDVHMNDLDIGVRTDIYIEEQKDERRREEMSLTEVLQQGR